MKCACRLQERKAALGRNLHAHHAGSRKSQKRIPSESLLPPQFHEVLTQSSRSPKSCDSTTGFGFKNPSRVREPHLTRRKMTLTVVVGSGRGYIRCHDWLAPPPPHRIVLRPGPKAWWGAWAILHDCALGCLWASGGQGWHAQAYMLRAACALPCAMLGCPEP